MSFKSDLPNAARRHLAAAGNLDADFPSGRRDVAAYLYGIAAECALKAMMWACGMRPVPERRRDDPFFMHFPHLRTALSEVQGRAQGELLKYANDKSLFSEWDVTMRYSGSGDVLTVAARTNWRDQAKNLVIAMDSLL